MVQAFNATVKSKLIFYIEELSEVDYFLTIRLTLLPMSVYKK